MDCEWRPCDADDEVVSGFDIGIRFIGRIKREEAERAAEPSPLRGPDYPHLEVR